MKEKLLEKRAILGTALFVSAAMLTALTFHSCQKDPEMMNPGEVGLKDAAATEIYLTYPLEEVVAGQDFAITFASSCGRIMLERGYTAEVDEYGVIINKVYAGLGCDTENLLWEAVGADEYEGCQGQTVTENLSEPGTYVYRAKLNFKAKNKSGCPNCKTFIGNQYECFTVTVASGNLNEGTFTDARDGHAYKWIKIGDQIWMAENLAYATETGSYAYNNDENNIATYGRLYTLEAAQAACPAGWHLPSEAEWDGLIAYLNANGYGCEQSTWIARSLAAPDAWPVNNYSPGVPGYPFCTANTTGFSALPAGYFYSFDPPTFAFLGTMAYWWSSYSSAPYGKCYVLSYASQQVLSKQQTFASFGMSVRCIKDAE